MKGCIYTSFWSAGWRRRRRGAGALRVSEFPFRPALIRLVKIFNLGLQLKIDWEWVSVFPLVGNLKISSATLKTFCLESMKRYSHSNKGPGQQSPIGRQREKTQTRPSPAGEVVRPWCDYPSIPSAQRTPPLQGQSQSPKFWKAVTECSNYLRIKKGIVVFFSD